MIIEMDVEFAKCADCDEFILESHAQMSFIAAHTVNKLIQKHNFSTQSE